MPTAIRFNNSHKDGQNGVTVNESPEEVQNQWGGVRWPARANAFDAGQGWASHRDRVRPCLLLVRAPGSV